MRPRTVKQRRFLFFSAALLMALGIAAARIIRLPFFEVATPQRSDFTQQAIDLGARLSAIGNCETCHTVSISARFAGGRALQTPFGTIYSTNITPDRGTGIGAWSEDAFRRSLREGVARDGTHLYPAFPYDHFAKLTDADISALYAYIMTRQPLRAKRLGNDIMFPFNIRPLLAGWKLLYLSARPFQPDPARTAEWNRGGYLVEGLGHCGACHTPRTMLGVEIASDAFGGGEADGWHAPALNVKSPAPIPWDAQHLFVYLREGFDGLHGAPAGPMSEVVRNLSRVPAEDVRAIALYISTLAGPLPPDRKAQSEALLAKVMASPVLVRNETSASRGEEIYWGACSECHEPSSLGVPFALSTTFSQPTAYNVIRIILHGIRPPHGHAGPIMPSFSGSLTDAQIAELVNYLRSTFSSQPPWTNIDSEIARTRNEDGSPPSPSVVEK
jgi:mono/diheme cytochrome c family protein